MHCAIITPSLPLADNGGGLTVLGIIQSLIAFGHRVTLCVVRDAGAVTAERERPVVTQLHALGVPVELMALPERPFSTPSLLRRVLRGVRAICWPDPADFRPAAAHAAMLGRQIEALRPDVVFAYYLGVDAASAVSTCPKVAGVAALGHLGQRYSALHRGSGQRSVSALRTFMRTWMASWVLRGFERRILSAYDLVVCFGARDAEWLRRRGMSRCEYAPTPIDDPLRGRWETWRRQAGSGQRSPTIIMVGHLRGLPTYPGLCLFAREVLPRLEAALGPRGFRVHIVGRKDGFDALPAWLARRLARPSVVLKGYVEDLGAEFAAADVCCVPTPIRLANRVRINVAFAYGACVVAHAANRYGMPELVDGTNVLFGGDGAQLSERLVQVLSDASLRDRLARNARRTYEEAFSIQAAGGHVVRTLERLAGLPLAGGVPRAQAAEAAPWPAPEGTAVSTMSHG